MSPRRFMATMFRLSLVVGIAYGVYDAYRTYGNWRDIGIAYEHQREAMDCAAKLPDSWLSENANEMGYADVSSVCGKGAGSSYIVNAERLQRERNGEDTSEALLALRGQPYDFVGMISYFVIGVLFVNAVGFVLLGLYGIGRWIVAK